MIPATIGDCRDCGHSEPVRTDRWTFNTPPRCSQCGGMLDRTNLPPNPKKPDPVENLLVAAGIVPREDLIPPPPPIRKKNPKKHVFFNGEDLREGQGKPGNMLKHVKAVRERLCQDD